MRNSRDKLLRIYELLAKAYGEQGWWPVDMNYHSAEGSDPREEIAIGAVLTQNTSWRNVEKALKNLKENRALSFRGVLRLSEPKLCSLIRPTGYYREKARRLKLLAKELSPVDKLESIGRDELLKLRGVGRETADVILLYGGNRTYFVIDAYTKRIVERVFGFSGNYEELRAWFEGNLPRDVELYKEFHALLDEHAKKFCRAKPRCEGCPLFKRVCTPPLR